MIITIEQAFSLLPPLKKFKKQRKEACGKKKIRMIRPKCLITCEKMNCINRERRGKIKLSCQNCRDNKICVQAS
ncbi:hypothetical protein LCGC14_2644440 [marine sediment metagenome]|uniref:Uncharacterized protein n=1 Tax=marine sediment metagenome TaxID=412755 RepID=A0A0F9CNQ1_9ZZZZ